MNPLLYAQHRGPKHYLLNKKDKGIPRRHVISTFKALARQFSEPADGWHLGLGLQFGKGLGSHAHIPTDVPSDFLYVPPTAVSFRATRSGSVISPAPSEAPHCDGAQGRRFIAEHDASALLPDSP